MATLVVLLLVGCSGNALPPTSMPSASSAAPPTPAVTSPVTTPTASAPTAANGATPPSSATPLSSTTPSPVTTPSPSPSPLPATSPTIDSAEPPAAAMAVVGSPDEVPGRLSSYSYGTFASDGPWLPARILNDITVPVGAKLVVRFLNGTSIADLSARYAAAADEQALVVRGIDGGRLVAGAAEIAAPPVGDWAVEVQLDYPAGQGSGSYYWHVTVTP
ncbi:MAG: hypothetical protein H0W07_02480 [Chloroflexi bacterium]|nr:hypothetical protein [Chloroflexota bacterium]